MREKMQIQKELVTKINSESHKGKRGILKRVQISFHWSIQIAKLDKRVT